MRISRLASQLRLSVTLALDAQAKALAAGGRDVVNMAVGEPDFPAPEVVRAAAVRKIESGDVRYTQAAGTLSLRAAVASHLSATRGVPYGPDEVTICHSAKHALSGAILALIEPGDEVLIPLPAWVSYVEIVRIAGGVPVEVPPAPGCRPDIERLAEAVTPRTRAMLLNSPCNPSGYVQTPEEVAALAELAERHDLAIVSDEIYRRLVFEDPPWTSPVSLGDAVRARTVIIDGASKCFAMTGYRIGFAAGPKELAAAIARLHSQMTGAPNTVSQSAFEAALIEEPPEVAAMTAEFASRRELLLEGLGELGLETPRPRGAFYAFPSVAPFLDERGSAGLCADLLEAQALALVPGSAFGVDDHVRLSYALSPDRITEALRRLGAFLGTRRSRSPDQRGPM
ncbi:MAG: pyridoxal phosphate-dependent aminotransferase [Planctomycetota bacterium]|nr:pyridoxal phosphate-dependent aminotransferase [Planctomycetota bacterium]